MNKCQHCNNELRLKNIKSLIDGKIYIKCEGCNNMATFDIQKHEEHEYIVFIE